MKQYVDMRGVIEVRTVYDDPADDQGYPEDLPVDMYHFQEDMDYVPDNFCAKDRLEKIMLAIHLVYLILLIFSQI